jgi:ABC-type bacteriocin/lantibiotic exporter with double-glycine peptidase domain
MSSPALLSRVTQALTIRVPPEELARVALDATDPAELLDGLARLGVRLEQAAGPLTRSLRTARRDHPVLLVTERSVHLVDGWLLGRARVDAGHGPAWISVEHLDLPGVPQVWVLEPALPAAPIGGGRTPLKRLWSLVRLERRELGAVLVFAVVVGILALATPLAIQGLMSWLALGAPVQPVLGVTLALVVVLAAAAALQTAQRVLVERLQRRLFVRMVQDLTARLPRVRIEALERSNVPELVNRFFDVLTVQKAASSLLLEGLSAVLQATAGLILLTLYHPLLLGVAALLSVGLVGIALLGRGGERTALAESKAKYRVAGWVEELARDPAVLQLEGAEWAEQRGDALLHGYLQARDDHFRVFLRQFAGMQSLQIALSVGLLIACGWLVLQGELTLGQLVAAEFVVAASLGGFMKLVTKLELWYDLLAGMDKLGSLVDLPTVPSTVPVGSGPVSLRTSQVVYRWSSDARHAFDPVDLELPRGTWTAVLGAAGTGKSTLAEVLVGVRSPSSGSVTVDGRPLALGGLQRQALLLRRGALSRGTVRENLSLDERPREATLWQALQRVGLDRCVAELPLGLNTELSATGAPLSSNQSALLQVARVLVKRPRLVVVDGLFDAMPDDLRRAVLRAMGHVDTTLVLLTEDPDLAALLGRTVPIDGASHVRID